jgi:hypothetical protein
VIIIFINHVLKLVIKEISTCAPPYISKGKRLYLAFFFFFKKKERKKVIRKKIV